MKIGLEASRVLYRAVDIFTPGLLNDVWDGSYEEQNHAELVCIMIIQQIMVRHKLDASPPALHKG